ncbi:MAG: major facilitator superfamily 1 [Phenylobacterium sp.]|nr:major facilitator superfamily 1 [Phenylobacterium sp.]
MTTQSPAARRGLAQQLSTNPNYRWLVLAVLTAVHSTHHIDRNVLSVVVEPIRKEFGLSDGQMGLIGSLGYALAFGLAALPIGYLVDRLNRRNMLVCILALWSGMTALSASANSFIQLLLARMGVGAAEAGGSPTAMSMVSDYFPAKERSTAVGIWYLSSAIGTGIIFLVGGYLAQRFGWRQVFLVAGIPGVIMAVLLVLLVKEPRRGASELVATETETTGAVASVKTEEAPAKLGEAFAYVLRRPSILFMMAGIVLAAAMSSAFGLWSVSFLVRVHGMKIAQAALWIAGAFSILGILLPLGAGVLGDRLANSKHGRRPERLALLSASTMTGVVICGCAAALVHSTILAALLMCMWCGLMLAHNGPANALVLTLLRPRMRGVVVASLQIIATVFGNGLGPFLVGVLSDLYGGPNSLRWAILTGMSLNVAAVLCFLTAAIFARRDSAREG